MTFVPDLVTSETSGFFWEFFCGRSKAPLKLRFHRTSSSCTPDPQDTSDIIIINHRFKIFFFLFPYLTFHLFIPLSASFSFLGVFYSWRAGATLNVKIYRRVFWAKGKRGGWGEEEEEESRVKEADVFLSFPSPYLNLVSKSYFFLGKCYNCRIGRSRILLEALTSLPSLSRLNFSNSQDELKINCKSNQYAFFFTYDYCWDLKTTKKKRKKKFI